ncbi:HipA domain-containing protein [Rhodobacter amnigenus]|uniref:HipA domain-containing protein n=1 Tax=Paragemmobacter amnigenus TaxID=2852097 RepID=UPI0022B75F4D|nr:HipA domain-containing protein [Rhodobacter amnigenus]
MTGEPLSDDQIAAMLKDLGRTPPGIRAERDFRISVAGAQEKTSLLLHDGRWIEPSGTTPTTHILKPPIGTLPNGMDLTDSVESEHFCLPLMAAFGLPAARTEIATFADTKVLVIERFDRLRARRAIDPPAARGLLPGALGAADPEVPERRRPRHRRDLLIATGQRRAAARPRQLPEGRDPVLADRGDGWLCQELQHRADAGRPLHHDTAL